MRVVEYIVCMQLSLESTACKVHCRANDCVLLWFLDVTVVNLLKFEFDRCLSTTVASRHQNGSLSRHSDRQSLEQQADFPLMPVHDARD